MAEPSTRHTRAAKKTKPDADAPLEPTMIRFNSTLSEAEIAASVEAGDEIQEHRRGWLITFRATERSVIVPDANVLEVLL